MERPPATGRQRARPADREVGLSEPRRSLERHDVRCGVWQRAQHPHPVDVQAGRLYSQPCHGGRDSSTDSRPPRSQSSPIRPGLCRSLRRARDLEDLTDADLVAVADTGEGLGEVCSMSAYAKRHLAFLPNGRFCLAFPCALDGVDTESTARWYQLISPRGAPATVPLRTVRDGSIALTRHPIAARVLITLLVAPSASNCQPCVLNLDQANVCSCGMIGG